MINILIVDDDVNVLNIVSISLSEQGYTVLKAKNGIEALEILHEKTCHLAIVDVMMPLMDGYELTKTIREDYNIPVILLTAKGQIDDKIQGFEAGTDDYLVKPFELKELEFRIKTLLRLYHNQAYEPIVEIGNTRVNKKSYEVQIGEHTILLPLKEFDLLYFLMSNPKQVFSREQLIEKIWGFDYEGDDRTVDVHIKRIRERFRPLTNDFQIKTVRGVGYVLEANE